MAFSGFSREHGYLRSARPGARRTFPARLRARICLRHEYLPRLNVLFRQHAGVSLLRLHFTPTGSNGMLTVSSIRCALRLPVRSRLTLNRLALFRNPWSCSEGVSRPLCRYLYLHLLSRSLQRRSRPAFRGCRNAPLPTLPYGTAPRFRHRAYARLLSMRDHSTSELLRTL